MGLVNLFHMKKLFIVLCMGTLISCTYEKYRRVLELDNNTVTRAFIHRDYKTGDVIAIDGIKYKILDSMSYTQFPERQCFGIGDYQIYLDNNSIYLYDKCRCVGTFAYDSSKLSWAILDDNR